MEHKNTTKHITFPGNIKAWYRALPDKKRYLEFITALLSIPVLVTVLVGNTLNLQDKKNSAAKDTNSNPVIIEKIIPQQNPSSTGAQPAASPQTTLQATGNACIQSIGPVYIDEPKENQAVSDDPVCISITRESDAYCGIVWSYSLNGSPWSKFGTADVCLYSLDPGEKKLRVKVRSIISDNEITLERTFSVIDSAPSPTNEATSSAFPNQ